MNILQSAVDLKKLKRATKLIASDDPDAAASQLQNILNEALVAVGSGNGFIRRNAMNELSNLRNAIVAGQIDAGKKTAAIVGAYNSTIKQFEDISKKQESDDGDTLDGVFDSITSNIPSVDTLTSALIAGNPIIGYGVKMMRDMTKSRRDGKKRSIDQHAERMQLIEQEKNHIEELLSSIENKDIEDSSKGELFSKDLDIDQSEVISVLSRIDDTTIELLRVWDQSNEYLRRVDEQQEEQILLKIQSDRDDELRRTEELRRQETEKLKADSDFSKEDDFDSKQAGILGGLTAGIIGSITGVLGGIFGALAGVAALPVAGFVAAAYGLYKFIDGFISVGDVFTGDIGILERVSSGLGNLVAGFVGLVDTVAGWFGFSFLDMDDDELKKVVAHFIKDTYLSIIEFFKDIHKTITDVVDNVVGFFTDAYAKVMDTIEEAIKIFKDPAGFAKDKIKGGVTYLGDKFDSLFGSDDDDNREEEVTTQPKDELVEMSRVKVKDSLDDDTYDYLNELDNSNIINEYNILEQDTDSSIEDKYPTLDSLNSNFSTFFEDLQNVDQSSSFNYIDWLGNTSKVINEIDHEVMSEAENANKPTQSTSMVDARQSNVSTNNSTNVFGRSAHNTDPDFRKYILGGAY